MTIQGRMARERERCLGMTPEERAWRAQYLKDQILTDREPVYVQELQDEFRNPIRRFYMRPLDKMILEPLIPKIVNIENFPLFYICYYVTQCIERQSDNSDNITSLFHSTQYALK